MKLIDLKKGDIVELDAGFTCIGSGCVIIRKDHQGLYFDCSAGKHYVAGQLNFDDHSTLVGVKWPNEDWPKQL